MAPQAYGVEELRAVRKKSGYLLGWVFLFSIFVNLLMLVGPLFMLQVYDRVLASGSEATLVALFVLVAALYFLMWILDFARGRVMVRFGARFQEALDSRVFDALMRRAVLPKERLAQSKALRDMETIRGVFGSPGFLAILDFPWVPIFIAVLFFFHPIMGWLGVASAIVLAILALSSQAMTKGKVPEMMSAQAQANGMAEQSRRLVETTRAQGFGPSLMKRFLGLRDKAQDSSISHSDVAAAFQTGTKSFRMFIQSGMLALGAYLVLQGELTAGTMIAGSIILGRALAPVEQALGQLQPLQKARESWKDLGKLLASTPPSQDKTKLPAPEATLSMKAVAVSPIGIATPILHDVNLTLSAGEAVGIVGPSGAGKSSLLRTLVALWPPRNGEVRLGGARLDQYDVDVLGGYIGYLPQEVDFFSGSITENIARMSTEPDEEEVVRAAKAACVHDLILTLPQGYDTPIRGGDTQLSGGQMQRIALARALYGDPTLLVLDEPNSALDNEGSQALAEAVRSLKAAGKIVVISSHRPNNLAEVDYLMVLGNGGVMANGPRDEVIKSMMAAVDNVKNQLSANATAG